MPAAFATAAGTAFILATWCTFVAVTVAQINWMALVCHTCGRERGTEVAIRTDKCCNERAKLGFPKRSMGFNSWILPALLR